MAHKCGQGQRPVGKLKELGTYHTQEEELAGQVPDDPLVLADGEDEAGRSGTLGHGLRAALHHQAHQTPGTEVLNNN